jgi:hypothetical protein
MGPRMRRAAWPVTFALTALSFLSLVACPGGDAPYTHHVDAGLDADADAGAEARAPATDGAADGDAAGRDAGDAATDAALASGTGALCGVNGRDDCGPFSTCDPMLGCVECANDDECPLAAKHCIAGACAACTVDATGAAIGCPASAPSCWPADHLCHPPCAGGGGPSACPAKAPICEPVSGECHGCDADKDCSPGVCSPVTKQCVQCVHDADCGGASPRCDVARGACVACASNDDCGLREPVCDPASRACRVGCTGDAQCPGERCDPATAVCVAAAVDGGADASDAARD